MVVRINPHRTIDSRCFRGPDTGATVMVESKGPHNAAH
jgi:hypothetical protein